MQWKYSQIITEQLQRILSSALKMLVQTTSLTTSQISKLSEAYLYRCFLVLKVCTWLSQCSFATYTEFFELNFSFKKFISWLWNNHTTGMSCVEQSTRPKKVAVFVDFFFGYIASEEIVVRVAFCRFIAQFLTNSQTNGLLEGK